MKARRERMEFSLDHTEYQRIGAILAERLVPLGLEKRVRTLVED